MRKFGGIEEGEGEGRGSRGVELADFRVHIAGLKNLKWLKVVEWLQNMPYPKTFSTLPKISQQSKNIFLISKHFSFKT